MQGGGSAVVHRGSVGAERLMASWHKSHEEASRLREVNRAAKALLVNHNLLP